MALVGDVFKGWGPGILIGVGAAVAAPAVLPAAGAIIRPLAKALIGARKGDTVKWRRPAGDTDLEIVAIHYP